MTGSGNCGVPRKDRRYYYSLECVILTIILSPFSSLRPGFGYLYIYPGFPR